MGSKIPQPPPGSQPQGGQNSTTADTQRYTQFGYNGPPVNEAKPAAAPPPPPPVDNNGK